MNILKREFLIDKLARQTGWLVAVREGDYREVRAKDGISLDLVSVRCLEPSLLVRFWLMFPVKFALSGMTNELLMGLLVRNRNLLYGQWSITVADSCEAVAVLQYTATKAGLSAGMFDAICREMVKEKLAVHRQLQDTLANGFGRRAAAATDTPKPGRSISPLPGSGHGITWMNDVP